MVCLPIFCTFVVRLRRRVRFVSTSTFLCSDRLLCCSYSVDRLVVAEAWALALSDEVIAHARQMDDRTYAKLSFRAVLMGFYRAMLLYVMNGCQWSTTIAQFAAWTVHYDMWCKMRFFADMLHKDMEGEQTALQRGPVSLLALLPQEFTRQQAQEVRIAQGLKPNPQSMLGNWLHRGFIARAGTPNVFVKK